MFAGFPKRIKQTSRGRSVNIISPEKRVGSCCGGSRRSSTVKTQQVKSNSESENK